MTTDENGFIASVTPVLIDHEEERLKFYPDSLGIPTIGVGFNLTRPDAAALCSRCGADYGRLLSGADSLTLEQSRYLLQQCIIDVLQWMTKLFPNFWSYSQGRQIALVDMGFNMGETKFHGFKQMISCILTGDWDGASSQALHSKWASQVPSRAASDAARMRQG